MGNLKIEKTNTRRDIFFQVNDIITDLKTLLNTKDYLDFLIRNLDEA